MRSSLVPRQCLLCVYAEAVTNAAGISLWVVAELSMYTLLWKYSSSCMEVLLWATATGGTERGILRVQWHSASTEAAEWYAHPKAAVNSSIC